VAASDPFGARAPLGPGLPDFYSLQSLGRAGVASGGLPLDRLPVTVKILLENLVRHAGGGIVRDADVVALAGWHPGIGLSPEIPFMPARVIMQDFTGVPAMVDLTAMRDAIVELAGQPARVNPLVPVDLVIDHSVQVDRFGTADAFAFNVAREYERNAERYKLLRWAQTAFRDLRVVPPGTGIVHQVNLEYLATVVTRRRDPNGRGEVAFPDTLVGTDSHTTMINGLGVLGYGVGGIEAEAVLLGQPLYQPLPRVVGVRLSGALPDGATATDVVLVVTEMLRAYGVVGAFVEFSGDGLASLALADRATISNMSPEFGATATLFPIDADTLDYLRLTGRSDEQVALVERYAREQGLWREPGYTPEFDALLTLDLSSVGPSLAGPRRPQDRVALRDLRQNFRSAFPPESEKKAGAGVAAGAVSRGGSAGPSGTASYPAVALEVADAPTGRRRPAEISSGSVAIAAITSCTNTSNPTVMVAAGLLARNAVARGLTVAPTVKTSLAPGSRAVVDYLRGAGLMEPLEKLGFALAGYGCTTCIGNSGPLEPPIAEAIDQNDLAVVAVLSGNRNFEGRIHPQVKASYLASPPLVVVLALAGTVDVDLTSEPIGHTPAGELVYMREIWPSAEEVRKTVGAAVSGKLFREAYASVFDGDERWRSLDVPGGDRYRWEPDSTYIANPPFFSGLRAEPEPIASIEGARVLALLGDSVTTDHISPAGSIPSWSPAGRWLIEHGVEPLAFNSYGSRRGHHEVMMRGTFGNIRLHNALAEKEGPFTVHLPDGEATTIFEASERYRAEGVPLIVVAGKEYGSGSSRDWAAKGPRLLGVRAVIAESFERIHRSNLVGMGILPLEFLAGQSATSLGLTGREAYTIELPAAGPAPRSRVLVMARADAGTERRFEATVRLDGQIELDYYRHGGILPAVLRRLARESRQADLDQAD
jgi:aconitate hydratase